MSWDSDYYKQHAKAQEKSATEILETLNITKDESILDIGCGDGKITRKMAQKAHAGQVVGIDISEEMIAQARQDHVLTNLQFQCQSAESFHLEEQFDRALSFHALHWVKDHAKLLDRVKSVLKPGGSVHFLMVSGGTSRVLEVFEREPWKSEMLKEERFFRITADDYHVLLQKQGFIEDYVQPRNLNYIFENRDHLVAHLMTWVPYATGFEWDKAKQFSYEIVENLDCAQNTEIELIIQTLYVEAHLPNHLSYTQTN